MDKTIEIVIVAMVILIAATIVLFLVQDQTDGFDSFLDDQQSSAQCKIWASKGECSNHISECPEICGRSSNSNPGPSCDPDELSDRALQRCQQAGGTIV